MTSRLMINQQRMPAIRAGSRIHGLAVETVASAASMS